MKEVQDYRTIELISLMILSSTLVVIFGVVLLKNTEDPNLQKALRAAKSLSGQLAQAGLRGDHTMRAGSAGRGPASVQPLGPIWATAELKKGGLFGHSGKISKDPWGQPFQYRFIRHKTGPFYLFVWSAGPNTKRESTTKYLTASVEEASPMIQFLGDDIGVYRVLK